MHHYLARPKGLIHENVGLNEPNVMKYCRYVNNFVNLGTLAANPV